MTPSTHGVLKRDVGGHLFADLLPMANAWHAIVLDGDNGVVQKFSQSSATRQQTAKDHAARTGYLWLVAQYPNIDLVNV
jgi:hypothetical protein